MVDMNSKLVTVSETTAFRGSAAAMIGGGGD